LHTLLILNYLSFKTIFNFLTQPNHKIQNVDLHFRSELPLVWTRLYLLIVFVTLSPYHLETWTLVQHSFVTHFFFIFSWFTLFYNPSYISLHNSDLKSYSKQHHKHSWNRTIVQHLFLIYFFLSHSSILPHFLPHCILYSTISVWFYFSI